MKKSWFLIDGNPRWKFWLIGYSSNGMNWKHRRNTKLWRDTLRTAGDTPWDIRVRINRAIFICLPLSPPSSKLRFVYSIIRVIASICFCSILLHIRISVSVYASYTAATGHRITSQRISPRTASSSGILFCRWERIFPLYLFARCRGLGDGRDRDSGSRLYAPDLHRTPLQYFSTSRVNKTKWTY